MTMMNCGAFLRRAALATGIAASLALPAAAAEGEQVHIHKHEWSFGGVFGQYETAQLQRGLKVYREACGICHSMQLVAFRSLTDETGPHMSEEAAKQIASEYRISDINNETGQPFERPALLTDNFPPPFPNRIAAAAANGGAYPPDFSLLAKARADHRGFPGFIVDAFANYQENGPDYIYSLLQGYEEVPHGVEPVPGKYYNPTFLAGDWISMPPPLRDGQVTYTDGTPETLEQYSEDVAAFMMWAAEPKLEQRKEMGFKVMIFLAVLALLLYLTKRKLWRNIEH
ncbi:cytochrome c1 [Acuticoccus sp. MNP-M23]|uniref:cytochrome c1 n=1 Tax=Acuticoccus sp. MNP-M23 TaxID=3072793 RepID=UPI002814E7CD|nr:cytochrome c1 [Acuticoccus sp. MNP-M23]WMS41066.1 cytochrome c1 [Acuticoccus sp. MNP-M23]